MAKQIKARFIRAGSGRVRIKGLGDEELTPRILVALLEKHGFQQDSDDEWIDNVAPISNDQDNIENFRYTFPFALFFSKKKVLCHIQGIPHVSDKDFYGAMDRAHRAWNKAGRPIDGVTLEEAMDEVLADLNEKRG